MSWTLLQRNRKLVVNAIVYESVDVETDQRRYTATICGWQHWLIYEGPLTNGYFPLVLAKIREIRDKIEAGDEAIFYYKGPFLSLDDLKAAIAKEPGESLNNQTTLGQIC